MGFSCRVCIIDQLLWRRGEEKAGLGYNIHVSLSHEKEYALAFVVIETDTKTDAEENEGIWL